MRFFDGLLLTPQDFQGAAHQGTQKHFQTFAPRDWSRDLQAGLLLYVMFSKPSLGKKGGGVALYSASQKKRNRELLMFYYNLITIIIYK